MALWLMSMSRESTTPFSYDSRRQLDFVYLVFLCESFTPLSLRYLQPDTQQR